MNPHGEHPPLKMLTQRRLHLSPRARWALIGLAFLTALYLASPYLALWRLDRTAVNGPTSALNRLVDIEAVQDQIRRRLNKDEDSRIGEVSEPFIDWIQRTIRGRSPNALRMTVTLAWLRSLLLTHAQNGTQNTAGFWPAISYAFFETPTRFRVQLGAAGEAAQRESNPLPAPVHLILEWRGLGWRVTAAYY
jgi:hypothetical protein